MSFKSNKMIERGVSAKSVVSSLTRNDDVGTVIAKYKEDKIQKEQSHSNEVFSSFSKAKLNKLLNKLFYKNKCKFFRRTFLILQTLKKQLL